jgi:hypothetical protein
LRSASVYFAFSIWIQPIRIKEKVKNRSSLVREF